MNMNEYQSAQQRTAADHKGVLSDVALRATVAGLGLVGEAGELANLIKKRSVRGNVDVTVEHIAEEAGDVLWYLTEVCSAYGVTLDYVAQKNNEKLAAKYAVRLSGVAP